MPERLVHYTFVESPIFSSRLRELASPEILEALPAELVENPGGGLLCGGCMARGKVEPPIQSLAEGRAGLSDTSIFI
jgi:hypothetical protein